MTLQIKQLGRQDYLTIWRQMQAFTEQRQATTNDECWIVEHNPVYTLGLAGKREHLLATTEIPVINTDRGGQITYHGPGQAVVYTLLDIKRHGLTIRQLVSLLEQAMLAVLADYGIMAYARPEAPGVYVESKKIGAIGLRIKNHCSYHGLSLNNCMDLTPFSGINPCGYAGLQTTQLADLGVDIDTNQLATHIVQAISQRLIL
ncbi:lipoyl(octanoyl) transferase LipB [Methylocucumis oryzae]|uniref:Octanoyltransferase n=1 Tax=Methylocucumis oryzae TaxID=1632867 RepID=A0A0F3IN92_9GAMM|nr:lipoyl(octanoyl) transferase LipB [Methylocucumis oryzae]KJV08117.1 hypothetical protein VZ94_00235 [Methylocucumis oryzae]